MKLNIVSKLENTRKLLQELGNSVSILVNSSPDIFDDPGIKSCLEGFLTAYEEAVQRLENPSFRIATIGTTSSGKSTIVNALIGRKIAPIEAGEMSGGVLSLKHSQERKLFIAETEDAAWETGEWTGLSDDDLYQRIRTVMHSYHDARKKREYVAPQVTAYVPLLPACDSYLLGLPEGIGVELIDLPGLKSVQDRANLATIQQQVNKAFSLVALDYMQVDDDHRKRLLEELKKVVEYLQGRTDSMIFILNRVDQRGADDLPLEVRIHKLREEIKEVLSLPELPDVLPFNARLLYYAQCAWGSGAFNEPSKVDQQTRLKFIQAMFQDCAGVIKLNTKENKDLKYWFRDIEDQIDGNKPIDDETMRKLLRYCLKWSGGRELWERFRVRVQESFAELVILPALVDVFDRSSALSNLLDILIQTRKINDQKQVEEEKQKVQNIHQKLHESLKNKSQEFRYDIKSWIEALKSIDQNSHIRVRQDAQKKGFNLEKIFQTVQDIEGDLSQVLILPVIDALHKNQSAYELENKLCEVIAPPLARHIAEVYDNLSHRLGKFKQKSDFLVKRVSSDDQQAIKELEHDERYVRLLYSTMRNGIEARANFLLQAKGQEFINTLDKFINEFLNPLQIDEENILSLLNIKEAVTSIYIKNLPHSSPNLPEDFFDIAPYIQQGEDQKKKKIGKKRRSCGKKTNIYADFQYKSLHIPAIDTMGKQWSDSIQKAKDNLWDIFCNWSIEKLNQASDLLEESINEITNLAKKTLNEQLNILDQENILQQQVWHDLEMQNSALIKKGEDLYNIHRV